MRLPTVTAGAGKVVSSAGGVLLVQTVRAAGLDVALSKALSPWRPRAVLRCHRGGPAGTADVLGVWAGTPGDGESAKFWLSVLTELRNRGVADIFYLVCDGLKGMGNSVGAVSPETIVQTCVVHLIRNSFRYSSKKYWPELAKDLEALYGAADAKGAGAA